MRGLKKMLVFYFCNVFAEIDQNIEWYPLKRYDEKEYTFDFGEITFGLILVFLLQTCKKTEFATFFL